MAGIFTSTRAVGGQMQDAFGRIHGLFINPYGDNPNGRETYQWTTRNSHFQTTTSFRSGVNVDGDVTPGSIIRTNLEKGHRGDTGHEFSSRKGSYKLSHPFWSIKGTSGRQYIGPLVPPMFTNEVSNPVPVTGRDVHDYQDFPVDLQYGTKAISKVSPTKMTAGLTQLVAELKIDLPKYAGTALANTRRVRDLPSSASDEYLNIVFGWQPTIQDLLKLYDSVVHSHEILTQFYKDSGRRVRRGYGFDPIITNTTFYDRTHYNGLSYYLDVNNSQAGGFYAGPNKYDSAVGRVWCSETKEVTHWFSGAFEYFIPGGSSAVDKIAEMAATARHLLGIDGLTLDLAYQLTPYTWLLDYFANIGDIISNATMFSRDNLVMPYAYLMRRTVVKREYGHSGLAFHNGNTGPITFREIFTDKRRVRATPYGFGLNPDGFSAAQWAILAALGLTKADRKLF